MMSMLGEQGAGLLLLVALLALIGLRMPVVARARVHIKASIERVFDLIDLIDGKQQHWHRAEVSVALIDAASQTYRIRYAVSPGATQRLFHAEFRVAERNKPTHLVLERAGLEGKPVRNELLRIVSDLAPAGEGTLLTIAYHWGPRPLLAQMLARTDLYGSALRIKTYAETGTASSRSENILSIGISVITGLVTLGAFGLWFGWIFAGLILIALIIHEFGHLLAFRLVGQPWGRLVFLPFLGALAMPRLSFASDGQQAFAALMGPAFSMLALLPAAILLALDAPVPHWLLQLTGVIAVLNLFNLAPVEPLDGGVALRTAFTRIFGNRLHLAMMASSALIGIAGIILRSPVIVVLGFFAAFANRRARPMTSPSIVMTNVELAALLAGFIIVSAAHLMGLALYFEAR
jgi:Zn-dependent protease